MLGSHTVKKQRLQRRQNEVETNVCSETYRISHGHGVCTAGGSREHESHITVPAKFIALQYGHWLSVLLLIFLACLVLVAFHVGK